MAATSATRTSSQHSSRVMGTRLAAILSLQSIAAPKRISIRGEEGVVLSFPLRPRREPFKNPAAQATDITVSDALDRWFKISRIKWCQKRQADIQKSITEWLESLPAIPLSQIRSLDVESLYATQASRSRSGWYLNSERKFLRAFWNWARRHGLVEHDPCDSWPRSEETLARQYATISRDEEDRLCQTIGEGGRWSRLSDSRRVAVVRYIRIAVGTGLRKGTIYALKWRHLSDRILEIPGEILKARKPMRMPLPDKLLLILGDRGEADSPLIPNLPPPESLNRILKIAAKRCGLDPKLMFPHQLRRTWVKRLHDAGFPMAQVRLLGGWASESVIIKYYYAPLSDAQALTMMEVV